MRGVLAIYFTLFGAAFATVFFKETFDDGWRNRWVESTHKGSDAGKWLWSAGEFYGDAEADKGIKTQDDAKFYALSAKFDKFSNEGKTLYIQFTVKHEQNIDCGGGYVKLFPSSLNQKDMHGDSPYNIMFGPDICGPGTKKVHVIFAYKGKNHLVKKEIRCKDDVFSHLYTLIVRPDQTYEVRIDDAKVESGSLEDDWDFLPSKTIKDPNAKKPEDWDEREKIDDADDKKPDDWDRPQHIPDPAATKPEDWDDEMDGEWEPPQIDNPEYKGEWKARQIDNPAYKGKWIHPEIDNPEYSADSKIYAYDDFGVIGFDLWQVKAGTIFDDVVIADDESAIKELAQVWKQRNEAETKAKEAKDEEQRKKEEEERKKEEEAKKDEEGKKEEKDDEDAEEDKSAEAVEPDAEAHDHDHDEHDHDHAHDHDHTEL